MTLSKESVFDLPIDALTEKSLYLAGNSQPVPTSIAYRSVKIANRGPCTVTPHYIPWEDDCCPNRYLTRQKRGQSSVFPSFLSPSVTPFLCQCYMNAYLSLRCISIYTNALKMYIIKLRIETDKNGQENPDLRETASNFFLHFVVEKIECGG